LLLQWILQCILLIIKLLFKSIKQQSQEPKGTWLYYSLVAYAAGYKLTKEMLCQTAPIRSYGKPDDLNRNNKFMVVTFLGFELPWEVTVFPMRS
jgi:hypothetical protein